MRFALSLMCVATLAACGGGGGESDDGIVANPLANAPACQVGPSLYPRETIAPDTCSALNTAMNDVMARQATASAEAAKAKADHDRINAMYETLKATAPPEAAELVRAQEALRAANTDLATANANLTAKTAELATAKTALASAEEALKNAGNTAAADRLAAERAQAAAETARAQAAADLATADQAKKAAAADKAEAEAARVDAANDVKVAAGDRAAAEAANAAAQIASAAALRDVALAQQLVATAEAARAEAQAASQKAETDLALAKTDAEKAAADRLAAEAAAATAATDRELAIALNQQSAAMQDAAQARLDEVKVITANLPLCRELPVGATPQMGVNCVYTIADQLALGAAQPTFTSNLYTSELGLALVETSGDMWWLDQNGSDGNPAADAGTLKMSSTAPLAAAGKSLTYTMADITMSGSFAALTVNYSRLVTEPPLPATRQFALVTDPTFQTNFTVADNAMSQGGQNFMSGLHVAQLTFNADKTSFSGYDERCTYTGTMTGTTKGYAKVSVTWGADCVENIRGLTGSGIITYYGQNTLLMVKTAGKFNFDDGFVSFFNRTWPVTPMPAAREAAMAKSMKTRSVDDLPALFGKR